MKAPFDIRIFSIIFVIGLMQINYLQTAYGSDVALPLLSEPYFKHEPMENQTEIWKDIKGYEGLYQISNYGKVQSYDRYVNHAKGKALVKGRIMNLHLNNHGGYLRVGLSKENTHEKHCIHTLVWDHFGDSPRNGRILQVDHINGNKIDNTIWNLQLKNNRDNSIKGLNCPNKTSKYLGVSAIKNKWRARIKVKGKEIHLGSFNTEEEAHENYLQAVNKYYPEATM